MREARPPGESKFQSTGHPARVTSTVETRERTLALVCFLPVEIKQRQGLDWRSWKQLHEGRLITQPNPLETINETISRDTKTIGCIGEIQR